MKIIFTVVILLGSSLSLSQLYGEEIWSEDGWEQAFARRNYQLGMTLSEFRTTRFPDQDQLFAYDDQPHPYSVCSNDETRNAMSLSGDMEEAGIVRCGHYYHYCLNTENCRRYNFLISREQARLLSVDWGTETEFYFIKPGGANDYFLYLITSTSETPVFNKLLQAYTVVMGTPTISTQLLQNSYGATFENIIAVWENAVSTLHLEKHYLGLDTLGIVVTLKPLNEIVIKRIERVAQNRARRL